MKKMILSSVLFVLLLGFTQASATDITIEYSYGMGIDASSVTFMGVNPSGLGAGEFNVFGAFDYPVVGYCIDYDTNVNIGTPYPVEINDPLYYTDGNYLDEVFMTSGQYAVWLMNEFSVGLGYDPGTGFTRKEAAAALQLAIWDAIYDFGYDGSVWDFDNGSYDNFYGTTFSNVFVYTPPADDGTPLGNVGALFGQFTGALASAKTDGTYVLPAEGVFRVAESDTYQDIMISTVPEPGTLLLFGFGLLGLGVVGRKKE